MSDSSNPFGFGKLVPGFDFLQNLLSAAAQSTGSGMQAPGLANWIAPTISVEDLERRISELKAVNFWLEQNARALAATIQALEVQKMTLATLKGMNVAMNDVAQAFRIKPEAPSDKSQSAAPSPAREAAKVYAKSFENAVPAAANATGNATGKPSASEAAEDRSPAAAEQTAERGEPKARAAEGGTASPKLVDPMQWWGALTSQFQQIAANAMQEAAHHPALDATRSMAAQAMKAANAKPGSAGDAARKTTGRASASAAPAKKKSAAKKTGAQKTASKSEKATG